jgi:hypothetical protein
MFVYVVPEKSASDVDRVVGGVPGSGLYDRWFGFGCRFVIWGTRVIREKRQRSPAVWWVSTVTCWARERKRERKGERKRERKRERERERERWRTYWDEDQGVGEPVS